METNYCMRKRTRNRIFICCVTALLIGALFLLTGFNVKVITGDNFLNNNTANSSSESISSTTTSKLESFAKENGLSLSDWPDDLIQLMNKNPETEDFVLNYPLLKDKQQEINLDGEVDFSSVPLFMQWDKRWGYTPYGNDTIAIAGCGPTCLSMVSVYLLKDTKYNPQYVAEFSEENGYCVPGNGTAWAIMTEGAMQLGLDSEELPLDENCIIESLEAGCPIICAMGKGDFTTDGHFIVMTDYVDGQIKVNDPNSKARSQKLWNYADIESQIRNLWAFSTVSAY